jgi:hypothetical protein
MRFHARSLDSTRRASGLRSGWPSLRDRVERTAGRRKRRSSTSTEILDDRELIAGSEALI